MNLTKIEYLLLFFFISFSSVAQPNSAELPTHLEKVGIDLKMLNKMKSKSYKDGDSYLLTDVPKIKGLKFKEIRMIWKQDSLHSLSGVLDLENGSKLLKIFLKEYGIPSSSGVLDIHEWLTERHSFSFAQQEENVLFHFRILPFHRNRKHQEEFNWDKLTD